MSKKQRLFLIALALVIVPMVCSSTCSDTRDDILVTPIATPPTTEEIVDEMVETGTEALDCFGDFSLFGFPECMRDARYGEQ